MNVRHTIGFLCIAFCAASLPAEVSAFPVDFGPGFHTQSIAVDGATVSVTVGGHGPAIVLLHGYAEDSRMWKPLAIALAPHFTVIAPDLPGIGNSSIPSSGLNMTASARRIHSAIHSLGYTKIDLAGHDIGLMVAYAYAALYPTEIRRLALMDAPIPGVPGWSAVYNDPNIWHFRFHGPTPLALVKGREDIYFSYFWNDLAADPNRSLSAQDRRGYIAAYSRPGRMAAGWAYFESFPSTNDEFTKLARTKLTMPLICIGGDKSLGAALGAQCRIVGNNVRVVVVENAGHWIMEEQPKQTMDALVGFFGS
jgi:pimeloyl-ACP methyl ester carboxylesterase